MQTGNDQVPANPEFSTLMYRKSAETRGYIWDVTYWAVRIEMGFGVEKNLSKAFESIDTSSTTYE